MRFHFLPHLSKDMRFTQYFRLIITPKTVAVLRCSKGESAARLSPGYAYWRAYRPPFFFFFYTSSFSPITRSFFSLFTLIETYPLVCPPIIHFQARSCAPLSPQPVPRPVSLYSTVLCRLEMNPLTRLLRTILTCRSFTFPRHGCFFSISFRNPHLVRIFCLQSPFLLIVTFRQTRVLSRFVFFTSS